MGRKNDDFYEVFFYDYGNAEVIEKKNLRRCPEEFLKKKVFGFRAKLAYIKVPSIDKSQGEDAWDYFDEWAGEHELRMVITRRTKNGIYCEIYKDNKNSEEDSINFLMLKAGYALLDGDSQKGNEFSW